MGGATHITITVDWASLATQMVGFLALGWLLSAVIAFTAGRYDAQSHGFSMLLWGVLALLLGPIGVVLYIAYRLYFYSGDY